MSNQTEAAKTFNLLKMFQRSSKRTQDEVIKGFECEANKPCPTCGK